MRWRRFTSLAVLVVSIVIAGCTATTNRGPGASPTAECSVDRQHVVDPVRDSVEPSELPQPPDTWTEASVERYVVHFERAYSRNDGLRRDSTRVTVAVSDVTVMRIDGDWVVELTSRTNTWEAGTPGGPGTPTVIHGDGPYVPVRYRITERALFRAEGSAGTTPSWEGEGPTPAETTVACFDG